MRHRSILAAVLILVMLAGVLLAQRRGMRQLFRDEGDMIVLPSDAAEKTEFVWARLRYPALRASGMWAMRGAWTVDYPKADRTFLQGLRRLTRIHSKAVEHVVDLVSDDIFNYPFVYVVEPGHWDLPEAQAKKLREYTDRGGFLMSDDFHGTYEWSVFMASINRGFADRTVEDMANDDPIFHVLYDLSERFQVPGIVNYPFDKTHEYDGFEARWRSMRDSRGRVVMAICHNMDLGDAWEWADNPNYPERYASMAYRVAINNIIYAMTH